MLTNDQDYRGLSRMTATGMQIAGVHNLHHARHILAVVCGLGMGVMAAVFLVVNVIADFWGSGTVGLPATLPNISTQFESKLYAADLYFPVSCSRAVCMRNVCCVNSNWTTGNCTFEIDITIRSDASVGNMA